MEPASQRPPRDVIWRLGEASFGVYLSWVFVEAALVLVLRLVEPGQAGRLALMAGGLAATMALGWLAWRVVELPAARWLAPRERAVTT
jgi:peptidoglycan/LPS O-acetylase OafA/YrhL